ncbi:hypothetical protein PseBG33_2193 [Pseudomonas synxantha BG33R]|uniref:GH39 family glycosyl hydrolase n=1 Tax=Pseudomonas synxantha TaxID=47883 RepID=UPI00025FEEC3|nr:hypothetical protein [Pseudomonas synxantha]EIK69572.1 hypothetical protein PseBG33_2193 [Pseudomonas synxantha BG33R]
MYAKTARKIKSVDASIQVGTSGVANPAANDKGYVDGLLDYCKSNNVPLDFFSWHHYCDGSSDPFDCYVLGKKVRDLLNRKGFITTKSFLTEWHITPLVDTGRVSAAQVMQTASLICSSLIYMQDAHIDKSYFYRCDAMHLGFINKEKTILMQQKHFLLLKK